MPIYMDRHEISDEITDEDVANIHQADLKVQDQFNCKVLSYYFDKKRNKAFCLVEAPDKESMVAMHQHSHGQVANQVIEVDEDRLESYLGGIDKPKIDEETQLYLNKESATRIIMVISIFRSSFELSVIQSMQKPINAFSRKVAEIIDKHSGSVVQQKIDSFLVSYKSASNAVSCALSIQSSFNKTFGNEWLNAIHLNIGINSGVPVTEEEHLFETATTLAQRMCHQVKEQIVVSFEVKNLYKNEKLSVFLEGNLIHALNPKDETFLNQLMDYVEDTWSDPKFKVDQLEKQLGYSKSQLYRKMVSLTGKSPNVMIREYRLNRALQLLNEQKKNITEIAFETGFNSSAYFSKCFHEKFGILPSRYFKQRVNPS
jgi:AraC-like DNA-binding protein